MTTPKYINIYSTLKNDIISGKYPTGSLLPTEAELMETFSSSRTTIRKALNLLQEDKLAEARQGRGTTVLGGTKTVTDYNYLSIDNISVVEARFRTDNPGTTSSQKAAIDLVTASPQVAEALNLEPGAAVYRLQRVKMLENVVFSYVTSYVPVSLCPGLDKHDGEILFLYKFLQDSYGLDFENSRDVITSEGADFVQSRILNVPINAPVIKSQRTAYTKGQPFEYSESIFVGSLVELDISSKVTDLSSFLGD